MDFVELLRYNEEKGVGNMRRIKKLSYKLLITGIILAVVVLMRYFNITCFILELTGIPCPGCGMTRALIAAAQLRFAEAFAWHGMFWSVPLLYLCFLFDGRLFKKAWCNWAFYALIFAGFLINWLMKILPSTFF